MEHITHNAERITLNLTRQDIATILAALNSRPAIYFRLKDIVIDWLNQEGYLDCNVVTEKGNALLTQCEHSE